MATMPYQADATIATVASMPRKVGIETCLGAAAANTAAKKAIDFGLAIFVATPVRNACPRLRPLAGGRLVPALPALRIRRPPNQTRYAAPVIFTASAIHGNVAKTMPTPRMEQLAQNRFTTTTPATRASASRVVVEAALCATATKFGPGMITPTT